MHLTILPSCFSYISFHEDIPKTNRFNHICLRLASSTVTFYEYGYYSLFTLCKFKMQNDKIFNGKLICGPMVRISTLGFRLLCVQNGADIVYSEEVIANKLSQCVRERRKISVEKSQIKEALNRTRNADIIEYVYYDRRTKPAQRTVVLSTLSGGEGAPLIVQIGASCPEIALSAAKVVEGDVDGIELNMGCPKSFSTDQGMGAALMDNPDKSVAILTTLVRNLSVPVSVKTRLMPTFEESIQLIRALDSTGVHAITLHCRQRAHRYKTQASYFEFHRVRDALGKTLQASLILNGDLSTRSSLSQICQDLKCDGFMVCRSAMHNPLVFHHLKQNTKRDTHTPIIDHISPFLVGDSDEICCAVEEFVRWHAAFGTCFQKIKYHALRTLQEYPCVKSQYTSCVACKDVESILSALHLQKSITPCDKS